MKITSSVYVSAKTFQFEFHGVIDISLSFVIFINLFTTFQLENISNSRVGQYANLEVLNLPFALEFKDEGIQFHRSAPNHSKGDDLWSVNIKKSLAALFQIKKNAAEEGAFIIKEVRITRTPRRLHTCI